MSEKRTFDIGVMKETLGEAQGWRCEVCGGPLGGVIQLAHRIPQSRVNLSRWGAAVIHDRLNLAGVCGLDCNAAVSIAGKPMEVIALAHRIQRERGLL